MIGRLVLLGAGGDLAGRFLLPALAGLHAAGRLPADLRVVGADMADQDDDAFRAHVARRLARHAADVPAASREALLGALHYRRADAADPATVAAAVHAAGDAPVVAYLALPQRAAAPAVRSLVAAGLPAGSRVAVEKPFGEDLASAVALNALLAELAGSRGEDAVFRVDHALGMRAVQDLAGRDWDGADVEELEVLWEETLALEGRAGFYDAAGALKDVLQNHMLQVLSVIAMEPHDGADVRDAKVAALRATSAVGSSRARYTAGRDVPAYAEESGVDPGRGTETFAEVLLSVDTPRWAGTRVRLRAGKALARGFKGAIVHHRSAQAEHIAVDRTGEGELSAYERVLLDVLGGASTLSVRGDEAEEAWRIVTPVLAAWADGVVGLDEYPAGSDGPPRIVP